MKEQTLEEFRINEINRRKVKISELESHIHFLNTEISLIEDLIRDESNESNTRKIYYSDIKGEDSKIWYMGFPIFGIKN